MEADSHFDWSQDERHRRISLLYYDIAAAIDRFEARIEKAEHVEEIAWIARFLLDLQTWVRYCDHPGRADQFWQDRIRDLNELDPGNEALEPQTREMLNSAQQILTGDRVRPKYVGKAALELSADFQKHRKEHVDKLSKFVHPTALSLPLFTDLTRDEKWCELVRVEARSHAINARQDLESSYLSRLAMSFSDRCFRPTY